MESATGLVSHSRVATNANGSAGHRAKTNHVLASKVSSNYVPAYGWASNPIAKSDLRWTEYRGTEKGTGSTGWAAAYCGYSAKDLGFARKAGPTECDHCDPG